jgi:hypothetical protein
VFASLRRVARFLRLALVCLALVWSNAPAAATPITDTVALIAVGRDAVAERARRAEPSDRAARAAADPVARVSAGEHFAGRIRASRVPSPPRCLYLEHRALLC